MSPINQVFLGGQDPLLGSRSLSVEAQLEWAKNYAKSLEAMKEQTPTASTEVVNTPIWNTIDNEIHCLTDEQREKLTTNEEYKNNAIIISEIIESELLELVRAKIENSKEGKELLDKQLTLVKKLKTTIVEETNREADLFKRFRDFSKSHPNTTYEDFIKNI